MKKELLLVIFGCLLVGQLYGADHEWRATQELLRQVEAKTKEIRDEVFGQKMEIWRTVGVAEEGMKAQAAEMKAESDQVLGHLKSVAGEVSRREEDTKRMRDEVSAGLTRMEESVDRNNKIHVERVADLTERAEELRNDIRKANENLRQLQKENLAESFKQSQQLQKDLIESKKRLAEKKAAAELERIQQEQEAK